MAGSGELFKRSDGMWSFVVKSATGQVVATAADGYTTKELAKATLQQLMRGDFNGPIVEDEPTVTCGRELTEDTTLEADLVCASGPALVLAADNLTLDLNGHTVSGPQGATAGPGILLRNVQGVTVQNGTVQQFGAGVVIDGGSNNAVRNVTARDNIGALSGDYGDGIVVMNSSSNLIQGNNVLRNGPFSGISLLGRSQDNLVRGNIVDANNMLHVGEPTAGRQDMGIRIEGPEANNNRVIDNTVTNSGAEGISVHATCTTMDSMGQCAGSPPNENNEISNNRSTGNGTSGQGSGIKLFSTPTAVAPRRNTVADNVTDNNATNGISVDSGGPGVGATENTIIRNKAHGNGVHDAADGNTAPPCDANVWKDNDFGTVNQQCVKGAQTPPPPPPPTAAGTIVISGAEPSTDAGALFRVDPVTGTATMISSAGDFATPVGVAVEANGEILVVDADAFGGSGGVIRVDPVTGAQTTVSAGGLFSNPFDLAVESDGYIVVVDPHASGTGGVIRVDPDTGEQVMLSSGQETGSAAALREIGIALEADGAIVVVEQSLAGGGPGNGRVTRIDPTSGDRTTVSERGAFSSPAGVVVEASGGILVADTNAFGGSGGVIRVDPVTGAQTMVSSGGTFVSPIDIALEPDGGILVADADAFAGSGAVTRVDPVTGAQTTVASGGTFMGPRSVITVPGTVTVPPPVGSAPPQVTNVTATSSGGSGEVQVTWDPLPPDEAIAFYRVYERNGPGTYWHLAVVTDDALGLLEPDRLGIVDAMGLWPWPSAGAGDQRCYVVTAVSLAGLEGPFSAEVCASPVGGEPSVMCGSEITEDTILENDLACTSGPALIVTADNITLDLNGHTISATQQAGATAGILLRNVQGVTVQNGTVEHFGAGVVVEGGSNNTVRNVTARDNIGSVSGDYGDGIVLIGSSNNLIQGNNVLRNGPFSGISLLGRSQGNLVRGNIVEDNNMLHVGDPTAGRQDMGIRIEGPEANANRVLDNTVNRSGAEGISVHATCTTTDSAGRCGGPPNESNEISNNRIAGNGTSGQGSGIKLFSTPMAVAPARNTIADNVTDNNATNGISVDSGGPGVGATENTIVRNKAHGNAIYDAADGNRPPCDANVWRDNDFGTVNHQCVRGAQGPPPPPPGQERASIGPIDLRIELQDGEGMVHVMYDINFSVSDLQSSQVYSEECRLVGVDIGVGDPDSAAGDDTLGFLTPMFNDNTTPEGGSPTLSRHFMKTFRRAALDEDRGSIPNPDEIRARVTLTPRRPATGDPIRRESDIVALNL